MPNPEFQARLALAQQLYDIQAMAADLDPADENGEAVCTNLDWYRSNRRSLSKLSKAIKDLTDDHPESAEATEALALAERLHLPMGRDADRRFKAYQRVVSLFGRLRGVRGADPLYSNKKFREANQQVFDGLQQGIGELIAANGDDGVASALRGLAEQFALPLEAN